MLRAFTGVVLAALAAQATAAQPMLLGDDAPAALVDGIPSMVLSVAPDGTAIAVELSLSQVLPYSWYADVFLAPYASARGVRRGRVVHLQCFPASKSEGCTDWKTVKPVSEYVLVESDPGPRAARRPIRLDGEMGAQDLRSLVAFIRAGPHPEGHHPPSSFRMGIDGQYPITDIRTDKDGFATVWLRTGFRSGEEGQFQRTPKGWVLLNAVHGIG